MDRDWLGRGLQLLHTIWERHRERQRSTTVSLTFSAIYAFFSFLISPKIKTCVCVCICICIAFLLVCSLSLSLQRLRVSIVELSWRRRRRRMKVILTVLGYVCCVVGVVLSGSELGSFEDFTVIEKQKEGLLSLVENDKAASPVSSKPLMVPLTLIQGAASTGAGISLSFSLFCVCFVHCLHSEAASNIIPIVHSSYPWFLTSGFYLFILLLINLILNFKT